LKREFKHIVVRFRTIDQAKASVSIGFCVPILPALPVPGVH
jgi:hypothetical protein